MIRTTGLRFSYPNNGTGISLDFAVAQGECVVLCGASGSGKTTITRLINGMIPAFYPGQRDGSVLVARQDVTAMPSWAVGELVGSVFQNPKSQFFAAELPGEIAFGCENLGLDQVEISTRTEQAIESFGLKQLRHRRVDTLSSGEKQRVAIASVSAMAPKVWVFDEPTANLDEAGVAALRQVVAGLKTRGFTLLIAEHRLAWLAGIADRYLYLDSGRLVQEWQPHQLQALTIEQRRALGLRSPSPVPIPTLPAPQGKKPVLQAEDLAIRRGGNQTWRGLDLRLYSHQVTALTGPNGAGKTTLGLVLSGLLRQSRGQITDCSRVLGAAQRRRRVWFCAHDTSTQFFTPSVAEEVLLGQDRSETNLAQANELLSRLGLSQYRATHPACLSGGERQRLALACALSSRREILIFDEPTSGLDAKNMQLIAAELTAAARTGRCVVVISHDGEFIAECCDSAITLPQENQQ